MVAFGNTIKLENLNLTEDLLAGIPQHLPSALKNHRLNKKLMVFSEARGISETRKSHSD